MQPKKKSAIIVDQALADVQVDRDHATAEMEKGAIALTIRQYRSLLS